MADIELFNACPLRTFAGLITSQMDVQVKMRGREIHAAYGPPKVITLPNMENATPEVIKMLYGFCLHEAGHLEYSDYGVLKDVDTYLLKQLHNALEDEFMERQIDRDFPGGRDMLEFSHVNGYEICVKIRDDQSMSVKPVLMKPEEKGFINTDPKANLEAAILIKEEGFDPNDAGQRAERVFLIDHQAVADWMNADLDATMAEAGIDPDDASARANMIRLSKLNPWSPNDRLKFAKRAEIDRAGFMWLREARGYPLPLHDWPQHPWKVIFEQETHPRPRSSRGCLDAAKRILKRLGIAACKPTDNRPVKLAESLSKEALSKSEEAREIQRQVSKLRGKIGEEARKRQEKCDEQKASLAAGDALRDAKEAQSDASQAVQRAKEKTRDARESEKVTRDRLAKNRSNIREAKRELKRNPENADLKARVESLEERIKKDEERLAKKHAVTDELKKNVDEAQENAAKAREATDKAREERNAADEKLAEAKRKISDEVNAEHEKELRPLENEMYKKNAEAADALRKANEVLKEIKKRDGEVDAILAPGAVDHIAGQTFEDYRDQSIGDEVDGTDSEAMDEFQNYVTTYAPLPDRKYCPFDRSLDRVCRVLETGEGLAKFDVAVTEYADIIEETTEKLRRLKSPELSRMKVNVDEGRMDPRKLVQVGLAIHGVETDLSNIYRKVVVRPDPKVAVQLILDCSASMKRVAGNEKTHMQIAQETACVLAQVMKNVNIPCEILGHTTDGELMDQVGYAESDVPHFSRFIPFKGLVFKEFTDTSENAVSSVFTKVALEDNLDGEAILWAVQRLAARKEKTKLCIYVGDARPAAPMTHLGELARHLLTVCRHVEGFQSKGLYLQGIGIGGDHIKKFFKNADVLESMNDLPKVALGVVERILCQMVGTLG